MKKALLLCLTLMAATFGFAQQQLATLNHNDSITVYYGVNALQQAHSTAVNGDIITLSPGTFNAVDITKAVSIRGNGFVLDTVTGAIPTYVNLDFHINIPNDSINHLNLEGICFTGTTYYSDITNPNFIKCYFSHFRFSNNASQMFNATFINCILAAWENWADTVGNPNTYTAQNTQFINCGIYDYLSSSPDILINCNAKLNPQFYLCNMTIINSILYNANRWNSSSSNICNCYNSIGICTDRVNSHLYFSPISTADVHNLHNYHQLEQIFKDIDHSYELQDSIANNILGTDSTQVGIYGGAMPYNPYVRHPLIKKCNVARRSTPDGRLAVDIEVISEPIEQENETENE